MKRPEIISYSRLMNYVGCKYRWDLYYNRKLRPRIEAAAPTVGSAVHVALAAGIQDLSMEQALMDWADNYLAEKILETDEDIQAVNEIIKKQIGETVSFAYMIAERFFRNDFNKSEWEVVKFKGKDPIVESEFQVPIQGWSGFRCFVDCVLLHKDSNQMWLVDWKIRKTFTNTDLEEFNLQNAAYQYILLRHGIQTVGSITYQILQKLPSVPSLNKNGSMSRALIASDWDTYKQALIDNNLNPDDYAEEMIPKLTAEFSRIGRAYRNEAEIKATWKQIIQPAAWDMARTKQQITRNMSIMNCGNCWARDFCLEELRDPERARLLIGTNYSFKED